MKGRVAIVTGGGRGIGEAVALALAREGARVVVAARTGAELGRVVARIGQLGGAARAVPSDVSQPAQVERLTRAALDAYGQIDVLVNAAGVPGPIGPLWDTDVAAWKRAIDVNLLGTFLCCHAVVPHMIKQRRGKVINLSGGGAASPLPRFSAYGASKAAVVRLTETLAEELREFNVQVNAIAPGLVDTQLQDAVLAAGERAGAQFARVRRLRETGEGGVPGELPATLAVWLASDRSDGLTGKLIAAPFDDWQTWGAARIAELASSAWLTLRRLDHPTVRPLLETMPRDAG